MAPGQAPSRVEAENGGPTLRLGSPAFLAAHAVEYDATALDALQRDGRTRFAGPDRVRIDRAAPALEDRIALVRGFLEKLA